jgi:F-type H+-transporting ATPase subunit epsilon
MKSFHLEILSPERNFYTGECVSLVVPISDGMLGIMAGRAPLTAAISDGEVIFTLPDGTRRVCAVADGMVDVSGGAARILCESALAPEEIDAEQERQAMEEARLALSERMAYRDYMLTQLAFARAFNNLRVKRRSSPDAVDPQNNAV